MKLIKQRSSTTCGQACIATLLDCSLDEAILKVGHGGITNEAELKSVLNSERFEFGKPPKDCVAICKHQEPNGPRAHWTVWNHGKVLDPACIQKLWPVTKYSIIR